MASLAFRRDVAWTKGVQYATPLASVSVVAYAPGAIVSAPSVATPISVFAGHGFNTNDKFIVWSGATLDATSATAKYRTVSGTSGTSISYSGTAISVSTGDVLVNLGPDAGVSSPAWTGSSLATYQGMTTAATANTNATVTTNANGEYSYWVDSQSVWEVFRVSDSVKDVTFFTADVAGLTAGRVALSNGSDKLTDDSGLTFNTATDALTVGGAVNSASVVATGNVGSATSSTSGAATVGTTLDVTGLITATGGITSAGHVRMSVTAVNVTGNDAIVTANRSFINLTNVSGTNTITLNAPSSVDGQLLVLRIEAITAGSISLANGGNVVLTGAAAWTTPGVNDLIMFIASGTKWYEIIRANN